MVPQPRSSVLSWTSPEFWEDTHEGGRHEALLSDLNGKKSDYENTLGFFLQFFIFFLNNFWRKTPKLKTHEGVLKEMEYVVVKQFSKFLFSSDRRNTVRGKENNGSGKFKLFKFFSRSILPLPQRCCKLCLCPSCRGVNVINEVGVGQEILALQGLSSAQLDLVMLPLTAMTWCWPVGSIAVDADLVKASNWHPSVQSRRTKVTVFALG